MSKYLVVILSILFIVACDGGDPLYCSRYQYLYNQLLEQDAPSERTLRKAIARDRLDPSKDQFELDFMEQVLNDFIAGEKPDTMTPQEYCMENERYKQ